MRKLDRQTDRQGCKFCDNKLKYKKENGEVQVDTKKKKKPMFLLHKNKTKLQNTNSGTNIFSPL